MLACSTNNDDHIMNKFEAVKMLNLSGNITQGAIKKAYRLACSKYHPDRNPAGLEMMKLINIAFDVLSKEPDFSFENKTEYDSKLNDAINAVINLEGVTVEVCGLWVWLSGNTRAHKDAIKEAGYFWASKKMMWYFRPEDYKSGNRGTFDIDRIRERHGSQIIEKEERVKVR
jgi:curved DNA-binding protein CbpA